MLISASSTIADNTVLVVVVTVLVALGSGLAWLIRAGISSVIRKIDRVDSDSENRDKENLKVTQEVHDKVDSHSQRIAYIEGKQGLPLGTIPRQEKG